jgi:ribosome-binding factor A
MARAFHRSDRISDLIKRIISERLITDVKDPRLEMVTITGATTTSDLSHTTIFFAVHGGDEACLEAQRAFRKASGFFRSVLRKETDLRFVPELHFKYDKSLDEGEKIERLLREVRQHDAGESKPDTVDDAGSAETGHTETELDDAGSRKSDAGE